MTISALETWHRLVRTRDPSGLPGLETELDGILVNGVDLITWNAAGQMTEFKVMLRPIKAINLVHQKMAAALQAGQDPDAVKARRAIQSPQT